MDKRLDFLKEQIKAKDPSLYQKIIDNKVQNDELKQKENIILNYLSQDKDADVHYIIDIKRDGTIIELSKVNSNFAKKETELKLIKSNYLSFFENNLLYQIDLFKDVRWTDERKNLFDKISKIISNSSENGYWLKGKFGVGKTHISIALLNYASKSGKKVAYFFVPELALSFTSTVDENMTFLKKIENFKRSDVLLIDDIGSEKVSEWFRNNILFTILNYREQNKKLTLFTSNISISEYQKRISLKTGEQEKLASERIVERLKSLVNEIDLSGPNYRN